MSLHDQAQELGNVGGGWLGTYAYRGTLRALPPVRFEATFTEPDGEGRFTGTLLDDEGPDEADVSGGQSARGIRFSETCRASSNPAVSYEGTLSDDGRTMQGTWRIADEAHGVWDARRLWSESIVDTDVEEQEEHEQIREAVRLG
jgi:hypothetical protein